MQKEGIAIIGIGCRLPGGVNNTEAFWRVLVEGRDVVSDIPADRWNIERFHDPEPGVVGKSITRRGGFISGIDQFDPQFFGISPREAPYVDPQQRLLLETAWEAIEDAGIVLDTEHGTDIGVFAGISHTDYQSLQSGPSDRVGISAFSPTGTAHSIAANRISYCLNLTGPSLAVDTACSSALTAVHLACDQLLAGRCRMALAGGVTVMITPDGFIGFSQAGMLSPDGQCRAFAEDANGFVRGEGAGMVLLKPLSQALADGDSIYGVIRGSSVNQDGHTNGISLPSPEAQARLVRDACTDAGIEPSSVGFVEAHGTGTAVGDPIEARALSMALCADRTADAPLPIGSAKTNFGHLETAAGVVGLIKAVLVLQHAQIPPSLHFSKPSPYINFADLKLRVPTTLEPFPKNSGPRIVGVNSFGFGGANAHVLVEEAPSPRIDMAPRDLTDRGWPLVFSARSEAALKGVAANMAAWLEKQKQGDSALYLLPALTYTLGARRNHHNYRFTTVARSIDDLVPVLREFSTIGASGTLRTAFTPRSEHSPRIAFVMSGQGPQWWGMGRELMRNEPVFRQTIEACAEAMKPHAAFSLLEELGRDEQGSRLHETEIAQPAIFAMQVGLAELWKSLGVYPAAVVGHSVGEVAAACVAGILSIAEASRIIVLRARLMKDCARGAGAMLAVGLSEVEALGVIARHDSGVSIAAFNGPRSLTLSGLRESLEGIRSELEDANVFARFVRVEHPFHHAMMAPAAVSAEQVLSGLVPQTEQIPFFSTVTGRRCAGEECTAAYWGRGIRQPVLFVPAIDAVADFGVDLWLEISPHPALSISIQECLSARGAKVPIAASTRREGEHSSFLEGALELHRAGVPLNFSALTPSRELLSLPAYPWDKSRWWHEPSATRDGRLGPGGRGLLDLQLPQATPTWTACLDSRHMAFLKDHRVEGRVIFPAAAFVDMVLEAGVQLFEGRPFVIEDFEIRKPLFLPESATDVALELSCDPSERTFVIKSRFQQSSTWSVHVVGGLRAERVESAFASTPWLGTPPELQRKNPDRFYQQMSDIGLRYQEQFRPVRELFSGGGRSTGRVALSETLAPRATAYALHPVLLDGALQVFSAGAKTVEDCRARMKLPVRFSRILYLQSPGDTTLVSARVLRFTDELTEGRIELYDQSGKPCVLVDGYRAVAKASGRRSHTPAGGRELVYHVDWERSPATCRPESPVPVPLARLQHVAGDVLGQLLALRGAARLQAALADIDDVAATELVVGLCSMGVDSGSRARFSADSLGVVPSLLPLFESLMTRLDARGLLSARGGRYRPTRKFAKTVTQAREVFRRFVEIHPGHLPEAQVASAVGAELGTILRGERDRHEALAGSVAADVRDLIQGGSLHFAPGVASLSRALQEVAASLPEGRGLRILEVGGGAGTLAATLLPHLERRLHTYTFTDVSDGLFSQASQTLAGFLEVEYRVLDPQRPASDQGFDTGSYDVIVGSGLAVGVDAVQTALRCFADLLVPGGTLMFIDLAAPTLWTEFVIGLTLGTPVAPQYWEAALLESGFGETVALDTTGFGGPVVRMARKAGTAAANDVVLEAESFAGKSWVVFDDESGLGTALAARVRAAGARCRVVARGDGYAVGDVDTFTIQGDDAVDWATLFTTMLGDGLGNSVPDRVVYLWSMDASVDVASPGKASPLMGVDALLCLIHALQDSMPETPLRLDLITRGAQPVGRDQVPAVVAGAASLGMFRVVQSELSHFTCRAIDLPSTSSPGDAEALWSELLREDNEREVALRGEARYVPRFTRGSQVRDEKLDSSVPLRLESVERGLLESLRFTPFTLRRPAPGEVLIKVRAAGMNFRDVLKGLALYPAETSDARVFGDEVAGEVLAIGEGVNHIEPGDQVFGLAVFGLATHAIGAAAGVLKIPEGLTSEEAATIPVVFMTAWHALKDVARLKRGEAVLIHAGAGGVGMAAIQVAHHLGATVIASAGSAAKRSLLHTLGVRHIVDSRQGDFAESVMQFTGGRGVDVVLNALASEAIPMGMSCLAEAGRFVEIGKRDIYQNARIPLWPLRRNSSFHVVAMDTVFATDAVQTHTLMRGITRLLKRKRFRPLPFRAFPASRVDAAFRLMASGKHTGKVVVTLADPCLVRRGEPLLPAFRVKPDAAYLITGGLGGYGQVISEWLVDCGARHLVLAGRSGASSTGAQEFLERLEGKGVNVRVLQADLGSPDDVKRLVRDANSVAVPLRGVFHLAMVLDDAPLLMLTAERLRSVIAPKAYGAWLLHEFTKDITLDCFVLFSSVSGVFGNPGQGNYAAANAFLDALAHHRRALGLPALGIDWGVLGGQGYIARNARIGDFLARHGTAALDPGEVTSLLDSFLLSRVTQVAALRMDWSLWRQSFRGRKDDPFVARIFAEGVEEADGVVGRHDWKGRIEAATAEDRAAVIGQAVRDVVGSVLRVKPENLRDDQVLTDLGLDSLMGVEIETMIEGALGVTLAPRSLLRARTIGQIAALLVEQLGSKGERASPPAVDSKEEVEASVDALDLDALSDEMINQLIGNSGTDPK